MVFLSGKSEGSVFQTQAGILGVKARWRMTNFRAAECAEKKSLKENTQE